MNIEEELRISGFQSVVCCEDSDIVKIFDIWINQYGRQNIYSICSLAYNLGRVHGIRDERTRRRDIVWEKLKKL